MAAREKVQATYDGFMAQKNELELALKSGGSAVQDIIDKTTRVEAMAADVKKSLDGVLARIKGEKDDQIRTLKDEIAHQSDMITKLGKEKRAVGDSRQKTEEDIQTAEDKCNHLSRVKGKLEQALDEAEDALEREKKVKGDVEKSKRKIEGDLKLTQEAVSDLERVKAELSQ